MPSVLPTAFLFRYRFPVPYVSGMRSGRSARLNLPDDGRLPFPPAVDGVAPFATLTIGWNEDGLGLSVRVEGKQQLPQGSMRDAAESDGLQVWIDTRDTQSIHRAGRFCHHFCLLPTGGKTPSKKKPQPVAVQLPIARARSDAPLVESQAIPVFARLFKDGYRLDAWLPAEALHGFDPEANPRLGFYYCIRDAELGTQTLSVAEEFPYTYDPSLWSTLELVES